MSWWSRVKDVWERPKHIGSQLGSVCPKEVIEVSGKPGEIVPCDNPENVVLIKKDPEPELSTKPEDLIGYCFGYVCLKKHIGDTFDTISVDGYGDRRVCQKCGAVSKPAVLRQLSEATWKDRGQYGRHQGASYQNAPWASNWCWDHEYIYKNHSGANLTYRIADHPRWSKQEFVRFLDTPKRGKK